MDQPLHAPNASQLELDSDSEWQTAEKSGPNGACGRLGKTKDGMIAFSNSRDPEGPALLLTEKETDALFDGIKKGEFDHLLA